MTRPVLPSSSFGSLQSCVSLGASSDMRFCVLFSLRTCCTCGQPRAARLGKSRTLASSDLFRTCTQFECRKAGIATGSPCRKQWKRSGSAANVRWILGSLIQTYEENETSLGGSRLNALTEPAGVRIEHLKEFIWPKVTV